MRFIGNEKNPGLDYFECNKHFKPSLKDIEVIIEADLSGPSEKQKIFFNKIESNYEKIISSIKPKIEDEFQNWKEDFKILDFQKEFDPVFIQLLSCEELPVTWVIAFESDHDKNHTFTANMIGFEANSIMIDG